MLVADDLHYEWVSSFTFWRTLHEQGLHPYRLQRFQNLKPEDLPRRIAFCQWLLH
jgi:hypothetical protein